MKALIAFFIVWLAYAVFAYAVQWDSMADWLHRDGLTLFWCSGPIALAVLIFKSIPDEEESK